MCTLALLCIIILSHPQNNWYTQLPNIIIRIELTITWRHLTQGQFQHEFDVSVLTLIHPNTSERNHSGDSFCHKVLAWYNVKGNLGWIFFSLAQLFDIAPNLIIPEAQILLCNL